ncbi:glycoside hydrolase [Piromyces finnis]|uniref:cellulase n=1 Tax=Piromyces finnis TaxID=1754191 RepID=A0A1Y1V8Z8_9FUNG|nr:glycoside hydrolase [Piromyces finnis]|eukprot:ORX50075.1 glycoside hydrolase [Piromyces finnis]
MKLSKTLLLAALTFVSAEKLQYFGANESSGEFGEDDFPGVYNRNYVYPDIEKIEVLREQGMNAFRVCNRWERLQHELYGELNEFDITEIKKIIDTITAKGAIAVIDPHNYARYNNKLIGSKEVPIEAFVDFWIRLAEVFKDNENVWFGLVNEPHDINTNDWFMAARAAVDGIRSTGAKNTILVPGNGWTGAWNWCQSYYGESNADVALRYFSSEDENILFEVHQYFDSDYSGYNSQCVQRPCQNLFKEYIEWLKANNLKGWVGEIGSFFNDECHQCIQEAIEYLQENREYIVGALWWAAGPWWGSNGLSIEPNDEKAFPGQMAWLKPYLPGPSELTEVPTFINKKVYCEGCNVTGTGGDGSLWGWENEKACEINVVLCELATGDDGSYWGWENGTSCKIDKIACGFISEDDNIDDSILDNSYCGGCDVTATGDDGSYWGWENGKSCEIDKIACGFISEDDNINDTFFDTNYCRGCDITATGADGSYWSWENGKSCEIDKVMCGLNKNESIENDYIDNINSHYCKGCTVTSTGGDGSLWGWESKGSCEINKKLCGLDSNEVESNNYCIGCDITATGEDGSLWGWENQMSCKIDIMLCKTGRGAVSSNCKFEALGYKCCSHCYSIYQNDDGFWGIENNEWCGIPDECNLKKSNEVS